MKSLDIKKYANDNVDELTKLLIDLCKIPAPSHFEHERAKFCERWFKENCTGDVYTDPALNVICTYGNKNAKKAVVFMAHTDTVFPDTEPMPMRMENGRLYCPGVGDDTANLAILMMCAKYVFTAKPQTDFKILFVANSCEEGLGNLKGCLEIMKAYEKDLEILISFDLDTSTLINRAVGSHRYLIKIRTKGGHSYMDFGNDNAIHVASGIINELYSQDVNKDVTYNVGTVSGGTSVNTIAQECEFTYEYRSESDYSLELMKNKFESIIDDFKKRGYDVLVECIGKRPGMSELMRPDLSEALVKYAENTYQKIIGAVPSRSAGSTDCNIPLSRGITSLCIGLVRMSGAHTRDEYVELESLRDGLELAISFSLGVIKKDFDKIS